MARIPHPKDYDLANFTDLHSRLGRQVPTGKLRIFKRLWLDDTEQHLLADDTAGVQMVSPSTDLFDRFPQLAGAAASEILAYARQWGLLFLSPQGRPCTLWYQYKVGRNGKPLTRSEPLEAWRYFSGRAGAVLNIAARLQQGKRGNPSDWSKLDSLQDRIGDEALHELSRRGLLELYAVSELSSAATWSIDKQRRFLAWELMLWLDLTRPGFGVRPSHQSWHLEIDYNGCLLAAVTLQLALTVAGARTLFTCSGCGRAYLRTRAARASQANFCPQCGREEALRQADQRRRQKMAEARRLHLTGWSVPDIVQELKIRNTIRSSAAETVRRWVDNKRSV